MNHELFEELEAFDPKWKLKYSTTYDAAVAANALDLYADYTQTLLGSAYVRTYANVPDYAGAAQRSAESAERFEEASS